MLHDLKFKAETGDLFWYNNPLKKQVEDYNTGFVCGNRPVLILSTNNMDQFKMTFGTSKAKTIGQIQLICNTDATDQYGKINLIGDTLTVRYHQFTMGENLTDYIGHIDADAMNYIYGAMSALLSANIDIPSLVLPIHKVTVPSGKVIMQNGIMYLAIVDSISHSSVLVMPLTRKISEFPIKVDGDAWYAQRDMIQDIPVVENRVKVVGTLDYGYLRLIQTAIIKSNNTKVTNNSVTIPVTEVKPSKVEPKIVQAPTLDTRIPLAPVAKQPKHEFMYQTLHQQQPRQTVKVTVTEVPKKTTVTVKDLISSADKVEFTDWFVPMARNKNSFLLDLKSEGEVSAILKETLQEFRNRTNGKPAQFYYIRKLVEASIDKDKAPQAILAAMATMKHYRSKK